MALAPLSDVLTRLLDRIGNFLGRLVDRLCYLLLELLDPRHGASNTPLESDALTVDSSKSGYAETLYLCPLWSFADMSRRSIALSNDLLVRVAESQSSEIGMDAPIQFPYLPRDRAFVIRLRVGCRRAPGNGFGPVGPVYQSSGTRLTHFEMSP